MGNIKNKILYVSTNDGSDMRINKEVKTLSLHADIYFLGVGVVSKNSFAKRHCKSFYLIPYKRNTLKAIIFQVLKFIQLSLKHQFNSYHIINEQLMMFFYPFLFNKYIVLDVFDSIFMKINSPGEKLKWLKKIIYLPVNVLIVTDENRRLLMPKFIHSKIIVLENFPNRYLGATNIKNKYTTIYYNGSMSIYRGTKILINLLKLYPDLKLIMAGWISDKETKDLSMLSNVDYIGVITQEESTKIAATKANFIMCCYDPLNENNINASPNKIYDSIQTKTPVIINSEVKVSRFVKQNKFGILLESYHSPNYENLYFNMKNNKYLFKKSDADIYSWEKIENKLLHSHRLY